MIYLCTPYSHIDESVKERRYLMAMAKVLELTEEGYNVYSPIVYWHQIQVKFKLPDGFEYYQHLDRDMIELSDEVWIYMMDGWKESEGVQSEIEIAKWNDKPLIYLEVNQ